MALPPVTAEVKLEFKLSDIQQFGRLIEREISNSIEKGLKGAFSSAGGAKAFSDILKGMNEQLKAIGQNAQTAKKGVSGLGDSAKKSSADVKSLGDAFSRTFSSVLEATNAQQKYARSLVQTAARAGAVGEDVIDIATATKAFSQEQLIAAERVTRLTIELRKASSELEKTASGSRESVTALKQLEFITEQLTDAQKELGKEFKKQADLVRVKAEREKEASRASLQASREQAQALKVQEQAFKRSEDALNRFFLKSLEATTGQQKLTKDLLATGLAAGRTREDISRLARETDAFSEEQIRAANSLTKLKGRFDELNAKINRTEKEERELIAVTKQLSSAFKSFSGDTDTAIKRFGDLQVGIAKFNNVVGGIRNVISVIRDLGQGLVFVFETAKQGAVIAQTSASFERFAENIIGTPDLLDQLNEAAGGTISQFDLLGSTLTLVAGLAPDLAKSFSQALVDGGEFGAGLIEIARAAQALNPALGDVDFFIDSLSKGIKRGEKRIIDNLGIVISAKEAYERYGAEIGKSTLELTAVDKQQAILNETLRVGNQLVDQLGGTVDNQVDAFTRLEAKIADLTNSFKVLVGEALLPYVDAISKTSQQGFIDESSKQIQETANSAKSLTDRLNELAEAQRRVDDAEVEAVTLGSFEGFGLEDLFAPTIIAQLAAKSIAQKIGDDALEEISDATRQESFEIAVGLAVDADDLQNSIELIRAILGDAEDEFARTQSNILRGEGIDLTEFGVDDEALRRVREGALFLEEGDVEAVTNAIIQYTASLVESSSATDDTTASIDLQRKALVALEEELTKIANKALPKQLELQRKIFFAPEDIDQKALNDLIRDFNKSFEDQAIDSLGKSFNISTILDFEVAIGNLTEAQADAQIQTAELNEDIRNLVLLFADEGVESPQLMADAFDILRLGLAGSAEGALELANDMFFVNVTLAEAREEAAATEKEMELLEESLEDVDEATKNFVESTNALKESLAGVVQSGFENARGAILRYNEAVRGATEAEGVEGTRIVDNSKRIAEINEQLFSDINEDTRKGLNEQLKTIRESGNDISQEYVNVLKEVGKDLSQAQRDELITELFDLQDVQGDVISGVFGGDPEALKKFTQEQQDALEELNEIRRQTVVNLFDQEGREPLTLEQQVGLEVAFDLITPQDAELILLERQFFDIIDQLFGEESIIEIEPDVFVDLGSILLGELGSEGIADLVTQIESAVAGGLGAGVGEAIDLIIGLNLRGDIQTADIDEFVTGAISQIQSGVDADVAVALQIEPEVGSVQDIEEARKEIEKLEQLGEEVPVNLKADVELFDQTLEKVKGINEQLSELEEMPETELVIIADTDGAQAAIDSLLGNIPEQVTIEINADTSQLNLPTSPSGDLRPVNAQTFQTGGFTGNGPRNATAGTVEFQEFVLNADTTAREGTGNLQLLQSGNASIVPDAFLSNAVGSLTETVSFLLNTTLNRTPTLLPAPSVSNSSVSSTNNTSSVDNSTTINNFNLPDTSDVIPVADPFG